GSVAHQGASGGGAARQPEPESEPSYQLDPPLRLRQAAQEPRTAAPAPRPVGSLPTILTASTGPPGPFTALPLTPAEQTRLAERPPAPRDRVLTWLASGDRVLLDEARRLLAPPRPAEPPPRSTAELLERLPGRNDLVGEAARWLAEDTGDFKSWSYYQKVA